MKKIITAAAMLSLVTCVMADNFSVRVAPLFQGSYAFLDAGASYEFLQFPNKTYMSVDGDFIYYGDKSVTYHGLEGTASGTATLIGLSVTKPWSMNWSSTLGAGFANKFQNFSCKADGSCPSVGSTFNDYFKLAQTYSFGNGFSLGAQLLLVPSESDDVEQLSSAGIVFNYTF